MPIEVEDRITKPTKHVVSLHIHIPQSDLQVTFDAELPDLEPTTCAAAVAKILEGAADPSLVAEMGKAISIYHRDTAHTPGNAPN